MSNFYIVATPIGNMGDITLRAIETLKSVDLILCEDTRETKKILDKYNINKPTMSYPSDDVVGKNSRQSNKFAKIFELLSEGKNLALVSDAGTPGISDPGAMLVSKIKAKFSKAESPDLFTERSREKFNVLTNSAIAENVNKEIRVIPIPGPSAVITALSACGLPTYEFTFLGFLPHKKGRETLFKEIATAERTMVFYESPHRILKTLESLVKFCPKETQKKVCVARELTKIYEEFKTGTPAEVLEYFQPKAGQPRADNKIRGEFTVIVS